MLWALGVVYLGVEADRRAVARDLLVACAAAREDPREKWPC